MRMYHDPPTLFKRYAIAYLRSEATNARDENFGSDSMRDKDNGITADEIYRTLSGLHFWAPSLRSPEPSSPQVPLRRLPAPQSNAAPPPESWVTGTRTRRPQPLTPPLPPRRSPARPVGRPGRRQTTHRWEPYP